MPDVSVAEPDKRDFAIRVKVVWGLYVLAFTSGWTPILGVVLAYMWRNELSVENLYRDQFIKQINLFWIFFALLVIVILLYRLFDMEVDWVGLVVFVLFIVLSIIGFIRSFRLPAQSTV